MRPQVTYVRRYMLQPVRRCCNGSIRGRVAPALFNW